jgi:hypothetical protein
MLRSHWGSGLACGGMHKNDMFKATMINEKLLQVSW